MKIETRKTTKEGLVQITTLDERWYERDGKFVPSVTWIASFYPKGIAYYKWLAQHGWDEAEQIKKDAGERGSRVHKAIDLLIKGEEINIDDLYPNDEGINREVDADEWWSIMAFADWWRENNPAIIKNEYVVEGDGYAGTVDIKCQIGDDVYIVDIKTSQDIWKSHEIQLSAYKHADDGENGVVAKIAILQVGYRRNKKGWKFTEIEDKFDLFLAAKKIWTAENEDVSPKQREFPRSIKL